MSCCAFKMLTSLAIFGFLNFQMFASAGHICDFEKGVKTCDWTFEPEKDGFRVVGGTVPPHGKQGHYAFFTVTKNSPRKSAMIHSPYYQHLGGRCKLEFWHRMYGKTLTTIMVTIQDMALPGAPEDPDHTRPAQLDHFRATHTLIAHGQPAPGSLASSGQVDASFFIDNITLIDCNEEVYHPDPCQSNRTAKYKCPISKKCINWDQVCDFSLDCPNGEDEDNDLHNCTQVPAGARCTMEDPNICAGWTTVSLDKGKWNRTNGKELKAISSYGGGVFFTTDHTYGNETGHFAYLNLPNHQKNTPMKYPQLISPRFPPTSPLLYDKASPYYHQCRVRFYVCQTGMIGNTASLRIRRPGYATEPDAKIWTPDDDDTGSVSQVTLSHCTWRRVSVIIPQQDSEYQLEFRVVRIFSAQLAIDDLAMTPQCFIGAESWRASFIPAVYNFTTCGSKGPRGPSQFQCDSAYNNSAVKVTIADKKLAVEPNQGGDISPETNWPGYQRWSVPKTGEYRIIAAGSAGGFLPTGNGAGVVQNYGAKVDSRLNLTAGQKLDIVVGQQGQGPCTNYPDDLLTLSSGSRNQANILVGICSKRKDKPTYEEDISKKPGSGGGGATFLSMVDHQTGERKVLVAASGAAGLFHTGNSEDAGGQAQNMDGSPDMDSNPGVSILEAYLAVAGGGGGRDCPTGPRCQNANSAQGKSLAAGAVGGMCAKTETWKFYGGFGGGGASCGPGGGGGAGLKGGDAGNFTNGKGGWSYSSSKQSTFSKNENPGQGYLLIIPCRQKCPLDSRCTFNKADKQICVCKNSGKAVMDYKNDDFCKDPSAPALPPRPNTGPPTHIHTLLVIIVVILVLMGVLCIGFWVYHHKRNRKASGKYKGYVDANGVPLQHFMHPGSGSSQINPTYDPIEFTCNFADLREVPRNCVTLIKALGQGAFGEVYEGILNMAEEPQSLPIAVKTLPEFATEQAQEDFHMEALIMSKFHHPNIVRFIGVCFERMPRFIVLELLAGGDLKSFLRENRPRPNSQPKLSMLDLLEMTLDVAKGSQYLEENHFIHRDIAARNCLLTTKDSGRSVKIADFGMARDIYRADYYRKGGKAMLPVKWMPPEAFLDGIFTSKTDVWSFGVLLWEIFSMGYMPYPGRGNQEVMQLVTDGGRLESPNGCPAEVYQLMTHCWNTIAEDRPRFSTIVERVQSCVRDPTLSSYPLPPLVHKQSTISSDRSVTPTPETLNTTLPAMSKSESNRPKSMTPYSNAGDSGFGSGASGPVGESRMTQSFCSQQGVGPDYVPEPMPTKGTGVTPSACPPYQPQSAEPFLPMGTPPKPSVGSSISDCGPSDSLLPSSGASPPLLPKKLLQNPPPSAVLATVHNPCDAQAPTSQPIVNYRNGSNFPPNSRNFPPLLFRPLSNRSSTGSTNSTTAGYASSPTGNERPLVGMGSITPSRTNQQPVNQDLEDDEVFVGGSSFGRMQQSQLI